jgi:hypothetical protein
MRYLSTFLSEFHTGFQKSSRFECQLYPPMGFLQSILSSSILTSIVDIVAPSIGQRIDTKFSMQNIVQWLARGLMVESTTLPSRALETTPLNMYGISEQLPYSTEYTDLSCTFVMPLVASDCPIPRFFDYWQNFIHANKNGPDAGLDFRFPNEYYATMVLSLFDNQDHHSVSYKFEKVYPMLVQSVPVSWDASNEFLKFNVTFAYSYWTIVPYEPPPLIEININL